VRRLSDLPDDEARAELRACCGSTQWVERMLRVRPFKNREEVFESAEHIWRTLGPEDWLEAFAAHPRIGEEKRQAVRRSEEAEKADRGATDDRRPTTDDRSAEWSAKEQAGMATADHVLKAALAEANRQYEEKFGYIYIVCATGRSGEEMLALARQRLANDPDTELKVAAEEQLRIMKLRLEKLLTL
jgi:OHCU decarboxylase